MNFARRLPEKDQAIDALRLDRSDEAVGVGAQIRRARWQASGSAAGVRGQISEISTVLRVAFDDLEGDGVKSCDDARGIRLIESTRRERYAVTGE